MTSYRRHARHPRAIERAVRQVRRHAWEFHGVRQNPPVPPVRPMTAADAVALLERFNKAFAQPLRVTCVLCFHSTHVRNSLASVGAGGGRHDGAPAQGPATGKGTALMAERRIRFHWHYNSDPQMHHTDLTLTETWTTEAVIKDQIAVLEGDRCLAQYMVIERMEKVRG